MESMAAAAEQTAVTLQLTTSKVVAMLADSPVVAYAVTTTDGALEAVGEPYDTAPYGIVLAKNQGDFSKAVQGAVQSLIDDGSYAAILEKWNVSEGEKATRWSGCRPPAAGAIPTSEVRS